ncbi:hypothetical protein ACFC0D_05810 [Streptomyces sp. NPDC056222]|uniref:hypothetical protein n=1 Tax=Streptomyces sp. NPDC056222 TaxID=3345749 RepID=UPI0035D93737
MTAEPDSHASVDRMGAVPPPPAHPPSTAFTAGDGALLAGHDITDPVTGPSIGRDNWGTVVGRDINNTTKKGGRWWIALAAVLLTVTGGGVYWATQGAGDSVLDVGAQPGEPGVHDTWATTSEAVRKGDGETMCALMTPEYRKKLEDMVPDKCAKAVGELFAGSESSTLNDAASGSLREVTVQGEWAEVVQVRPGDAEPSYSYMERFGDRWRWSHRVLFAEFHPDECPGGGWSEGGSQDPKCGVESLFPSDASGQ